MRPLLVFLALFLAAPGCFSQAHEAPLPWDQAVLSATAAEVRGLLAAGADPRARNSRGRSVLFLAAAFNPDPEVVRLLVSAGASLEDRDPAGRTPLMAAALGNTAPVVEALLALGADPRAQDRDRRTPYGYAQANRSLNATPTLWTLHDRQYGAFW